MLSRIWTLTKSRTKEFYRDRSALAWNIIFPFFVIIGFSFLFNQDSRALYKVGVIHGLNGVMEQTVNVKTKSIQREMFTEFKKTRFIEVIEFNDRSKAMDLLQHHKLDFLINPDEGTYWMSSTSPKSYIVEKILLSTRSTNTDFYAKKSVTGREIPYIEWLFPGIICMNIMFSALFGVGYIVVRYRKNGVLKRLSVTPVKRFEFLSAQILSRMFVIIVTTVIVYAGCAWLYGFECRGSYVTLFIAFTLGGFSLVTIALLVSARSSSEEFAGGILNLISWPMMFLSEVWFSLEGAEPWVKKVSQFLPLTHMIDSARKIMNDGASFGDVQFEFLIMAGTSLLFLVIGSAFFKWQ